MKPWIGIAFWKGLVIQALIVHSSHIKLHVGPSSSSNSYSLHYSTSPTTSFFIPFSHVSYSSLCRVIHFSHDLDSWKSELNPQRVCCLSPQKIPARWRRMFLQSCSHFPACLIFYCRSQLGLSARWVMPPIWFFVSGHQHFIFFAVLCAVIFISFNVQECRVSVYERSGPYSMIR